MKRQVRLLIRYTTNLFAMVSRQRGNFAAAIVSIRFITSGLAMLVRLAFWGVMVRPHSERVGMPPAAGSNSILSSLNASGVLVKTYRINADDFHHHITSFSYPQNYAAGPIAEGGSREQKILEYFVSLDLLDIKSSDIVIDVASEWSIFPEVVRKLTGATVYRQDLNYKPGLKGEFIGGNAAHMPVQDAFANKIVLHNAFEHFEGTTDTDFIIEAWRVLKPGGVLCILPLDVADHYTIITSPLVNRRGIVWDERARVIEQTWWLNRFGRYYDTAALMQRVLTPEQRFNTTVYHIVNLGEVHPKTYLHFALVMQKLHIQDISTGSYRPGGS